MFLTTNRLITGLFILFLVAAAVFAFERVLFADASFILFRIINTGSLQIQEHRYGSFVTQGVPWLAAAIKLPLQAVVVLYSISFPLFYLATVLLLLYRFRQKELAVLMSFYFLLFVSDTWFWMNNEVHQGTAWMFLQFGFSLTNSKGHLPLALHLLLFLLLSFFTLYTHPLILIPASYLWLFFISKNDWPYSRKYTFFLSVILLLLALSKLYWSSGGSSAYDGEKLQGIKSVSLSRFINAFRSPLAAEIGKRMVTQYWPALVIFATGMVALWRNKEWWLLLLTAGYLLLYLAAICLTFTDFTPFYTESELMPATIILTAPFVYFVLPKMAPRTELVVMCAVILLRLTAIGLVAPKWVARQEWLQSTLLTMKQEKISKAIVPEMAALKKDLLLTWAVPEESLLASALQGEEPQRTFVVADPKAIAWRLRPDSTTLISSFELLPYNSLNRSYFRPDSASSYQVLARP